MPRESFSRTQPKLCTGRALTWRTTFPPSAFLTLLTAFSSRGTAGLFHPTGTPGILPFRAFPSRVAVAPSGARCPLVVTGAVIASARLQGLAPRGSPLAATGVSTGKTTPMLSWGFSPPGLSPSSRWLRLRETSSPRPQHSAARRQHVYGWTSQQLLRDLGGPGTR
jgi:hypothetical protein